jgi:hypothetical protein
VGGEMLPEWLNHFIKNINIYALKASFLSYLGELNSFRFSLFNPLLWVFWLIAFLLFSKQWGYKKAFSFCLIVVIILLGNTLLENHLTNTLGISEFTIERAIAVLIIVIISLYYFFIRD